MGIWSCSVGVHIQRVRTDDPWAIGRPGVVGSHPRAKDWKEEKEGRVLVGYMPIYFPREILHAAGAMPVGIFGGGDNKQIINFLMYIIGINIFFLFIECF